MKSEPTRVIGNDAKATLNAVESVGFGEIDDEASLVTAIWGAQTGGACCFSGAFEWR